MLSSALRSKRAVQMNIQIMRTFVRLLHPLNGLNDWNVWNGLQFEVDGAAGGEEKKDWFLAEEKAAAYRRR